MLSLDVTFERFNLTRKPPLSLVHRSIISDQALADSLACFIWTSIEFLPYLTFQLRLATSSRTSMPRFCKYFATRQGRLLLNCHNPSPDHAFTRRIFSDPRRCSSLSSPARRPTRTSGTKVPRFQPLVSLSIVAPLYKFNREPIVATNTIN